MSESEQPVAIDGTKKCIHCAEEIKSEASFCKYCKQVVDESAYEDEAAPGTKLCPFCAEEIKKAAIRCKHCQSDLKSPKTVSKVSTPVPVQNKASEEKQSPVPESKLSRRGLKLWYGVVLGVPVVACIVGSFSYEVALIAYRASGLIVFGCLLFLFSKKIRRHALISLCLLLGLQYLNYCNIYKSLDSFSPSTAAEPNKQSERNQNEDGTQVYPRDTNASYVFIGEPVVLDDIEYVINSVKCGQSVGNNSYTSQSAEDGASFVVVGYTVLNKKKETTTFFPDMKLTAKDNTIYSQDAKGQTAATMSGMNKDFLVSQLQPGITKKGLMVFELPKDKISQGFVISMSSASLFDRHKVLILNSTQGDDYFHGN
ncbi:MAG: DUF4352 domain-containing protein [Candidatus Melainabacteria bacterium]|nr:DUF4352 domain-containing protein [Candidatus Melainabacteria bacterium]